LMHDYPFRNLFCLQPRQVFGRTLESSRLEPTQRVCSEHPHANSGVKLPAKCRKHQILLILIIISST
jgi:hypothetical protein